MYAWYVNLLGREEADKLLNAPLPGTEEEQAAKDEAFNSGLANIYQELGVPWQGP